MVDLERVEMMASGDPKWDLSPNDIAALKGIIAELRAARECVRYMQQAMDVLNADKELLAFRDNVAWMTCAMAAHLDAYDRAVEVRSACE